MSIRPRLRALAVMAAFVSMVPGCATYWKNRATDLIDPFGLGFDVGGGFGFNVRATQFVQAGLSAAQVLERPIIRFVGRRVFLESESAEAGLAPFYYHRSSRAFSKGEEVREVVLSRTHIRGDDSIVLLYLPEKKEYDVKRHQTDEWSHLPDRKSFERNYDRRLFDLGVSAYAVVRVDVEFNPFELLDFFLGFVGIDIAGDDAPEAPGEPPPGSYNAAALVRLLASEDLQVRGAAREELARLGGVTVPALGVGLKDDDPSVRRESAEALGDLAAAGRLADARPLEQIAVPGLIQGLKDDDWNVRYACAWALGRCGAAARPAVDALKALRENDSQFLVRQIAGLALARIGAD